MTVKLWHFFLSTFYYYSLNIDSCGILNHMWQAFSGFSSLEASPIFFSIISKRVSKISGTSDHESRVKAHANAGPAPTDTAWSTRTVCTCAASGSRSTTRTSASWSWTKCLTVTTTMFHIVVFVASPRQLFRI